MQLLVLLPEGYRKKLASTTDEKTSLELKRELRQRVHKITDQLDEIGLRRLTEEYPIPPDREQWDSILSHREEKKAMPSCGKALREKNVYFPPPLLISTVHADFLPHGTRTTFRGRVRPGLLKPLFHIPLKPEPPSFLLMSNTIYHRSPSLHLPLLLNL